MTAGVGAAALAAISVVLAMSAVALRADREVMLRAGLGGTSPAACRFHEALRSLAARVGAAPWPGVDRGSLAAGIGAAGWAASVDQMVGGKAAAAVVGLLLALTAPWPAPLLSPVLAVVGFRVPDVALARAIARRASRADRELPQLLDVLAAASSAGLSGPLALRRAVTVIRGPLAEELREVLRAVELGGRWRDELRGAADRLGLPDLRRAVGALTRTEALGTSLSEALSELAGQVREARRAAAGERARKAPVKMLFPLVFMVLPAFLLLTVVPVLVATFRSIR